MKTFDLLLFAGNEPISGLIRKFEYITLGNGKWSHVGVVLEGKHLPGILNPDSIYVWESTVAFDVPDVLTGVCGSGVQIRDLKLLCKHYNGKIACAPLINDYSDEHKIKIVKKIHDRYSGTGYAKNPFTLVTALCCCLRPISQSEDEGVFCSQFVGEIYKELGVINVDSKNIVPVDFLGGDYDGMPVVVGDVTEIKK